MSAADGESGLLRSGERYTLEQKAVTSGSETGLVSFSLVAALPWSDAIALIPSSLEPAGFLTTIPLSNSTPTTQMPVYEGRSIPDTKNMLIQDLLVQVSTLLPQVNAQDQAVLRDTQSALLAGRLNVAGFMLRGKWSDLKAFAGHEKVFAISTNAHMPAQLPKDVASTRIQQESCA